MNPVRELWVWFEGAQEKRLSVTALSPVLESEESNFYSSISGSDVSGSETEGRL